MSDRIGPTAHYTGYVWAKNGLAPDGFATLEGAAAYNAFRLPLALFSKLGVPSLENVLLARHQVIDDFLDKAIEAGDIGQVIEVAAGLSPRGCRFAERYGDKITYIEADLPAMADRKRALLNKLGAGSSNHRAVDIDALVDDGPLSLASIAAQLDRDKGLAIITEGLVNYFDLKDVQGFWARFAKVINQFPQGLYLSDIHVSGENQSAAIASFGKVLAAFVRGRIHMHFDNAAAAEEALLAAGFSHSKLHRPADIFSEYTDPGSRLVRVIEARL